MESLSEFFTLESSAGNTVASFPTLEYRIIGKFGIMGGRGGGGSENFSKN